jgi:hypothetical protein
MHAANESRRPVTGQRSKGPKNGRAPSADGCARDPAGGRRRRENRKEFRLAPSLSRHVSSARSRAPVHPSSRPVTARACCSAEQEMDRVRRGLCAVSSFLQVNKRSECGGAHVHVERSATATRIYRLPSSIASSSTIIVVIKRMERE